MREGETWYLGRGGLTHPLHRIPADQHAQQVPDPDFCPVYFVLNKMMPDTEPIQDGSRS